MSLVNSKYQYFSEEIIWGARFSQRAVLYSKAKENIGSMAQRDIDKVIMERNLPVVTVSLVTAGSTWIIVSVNTNIWYPISHRHQTNQELGV